MTFPLLRLPILASIKVIKNIEVRHLIPLIYASKRTKILVKISKVHLKLTVHESAIQFHHLFDEGLGERLTFFDLSGKQPIGIPFRPPFHLEFDTRVQYRIGTYKKVMDDFMEFFIIRSVKFELQEACSYITYCYMKHARDLGLKFTTARVTVGGSNGKIYQKLLKVCSYASQLQLLFDTNEEFTFNGFNEYRTYKLKMSHKRREIDLNWFTVDHLCSLVNCWEVSVQDLKWRSEDFNRFLKFWMKSDGRLEFLKLSQRSWESYIDRQIVLNGIENIPLLPNHNQFEIQRADGVRAHVTLDRTRFHMRVIVPSKVFFT